MKTEIEISYPKDIVDIIKARKAFARVQAGSSNAQVEPRNVTSDPALQPSFVPASEVAPSNLALGNKFSFFFILGFCVFPVKISKCNCIYSN